MMRWIVGLSLRFRLVVVAVAAVMMFFGFRQLRGMPVDVLPEFSRPYVEIQAEALGLSAEEVEAMITTPLEADMLNGSPWVEEIRSQSIPGLASIKLFFEPGTNLLDGRQMVQERMTQMFALPGVSKPPVMLQPLSSTSRCMKVGLSSEDLSLIQMSVLARWTIKPRLMGVPGVANVSIWGQRERQLQVQVDPTQLREKGVTLNQIISTTGNAMWVSPLTFLDAHTPGTGGFIDTPNQRLGIQHVLPISSSQQLANVTVEGTQMRLGDVAKVVEDHQPLIGDAVVHDAPALMLVIDRFPWASTLDVTRGVEQALEALQPGLSGLKMDTSLFRPATYIEIAMRNLTASLLIGGALVALLLFAFLYNWRSGLIGLVAILTSVVAAGIVLYLFGTAVNMMVLAGLLIALGVIIDDAIVDTQNIVRRLRQHRAESGSEESIAWIIREATVEMRGVILYATLIILLAVAPILFTQGVPGAFFRPLAYSYALAVVVSMLAALTVTPVLAVLLLRNAPLDSDKSPLVRALRAGYDAAFSRVLHKPAPAFCAVGVIALAGVLVFPWVRQESLLPAFKELELLIDMDGKPGTSHPAMRRITTQASRELRSIPGVKNVSAHIGRAVMSDEVADINSSELWVSIDPAADYDATLDRIKQVVAGYPGLDREIGTYLSEQISKHVKGGEDRGIVVRVYGEDLKVLRGKAEEVRDMLAKIDGVVDLQVDSCAEEPRVEIEPDLARCQKHGLKPGDVRRAAAALLSGIEVGSLFEEQKVFEVVVWGAPETRDSLTSVKELLIDTPAGGHVTLQEVAEVRIASGPTVINREAVARYIDVSGGVRGRDLASIGGNVKSGLAEIKFPLEYRAELLGAPAERLAAQQRLQGFAIAAAIGILLLLQVAFGSWRLASLVFLTLPLALVGGVVAAFATGGIISFGSIVGFFAVLGIAVRNGMVLIHRYQHLAANPQADQVDPEVAQFRAQFDQASPLDEVNKLQGDISPELVLHGTRERLVPITMTALATALALLPLVIAGNIAGHEIVYPMAVVILGGLVTSTLVSLYVLPALYLWLKAKPATDIVAEPMAVEAEAEHTAVK